MTSRRTLQRECIDAYFPSNIRMRVIVPRKVKQQLNAIKTVIVDTPALTDGSLTLDRHWTLGETDRDLFKHASKALVGEQTPQTKHLKNALNIDLDTKAHLPPLATYRGRINRSVWHHGEHFMSYCMGEPANIILLCDLTENEREEVSQRVRLAMAQGSIVFAVAHGTTSTPPTTIRSYSMLQRLTFDGLIFFHPHIYTGTEYALEKLRERGLSVIYASSDTERQVTTLAHLTCLTPQTILAYRCTNDQPQLKKQLYSHMSERAKARLISHYGESAIVVKHPLPKFVELLESIS